MPDQIISLVQQFFDFLIQILKTLLIKTTSERSRSCLSEISMVTVGQKKTFIEIKILK